MELIPVLTITALGGLGFCLMTAAFVLGARTPRFTDAATGAPPSVKLPRRLMLAGATLGAAFGLLLLVPGVLPWVNTPAEYGDLWLGAVSGIGIACCVLYSVRNATVWAK